MASSKRVLWNKVGRYFSAVVIAAFFLPFFGVSCEGMDVITVSGADMVGGCKPGGMITDMEKEEGNRGRKHDVDDDDHSSANAPRHRGGDGGLDMKVDKVEVEPIAIIAMALALGLFGAAWVRSRKGMTASLALSIACIGALVALYIKVGGELKDAVDKETLAKSEGKMAKDVKVNAGGRYGLWLSFAMLAGCAYITGRALRETGELPTDPPPVTPPVTPPVA